MALLASLPCVVSSKGGLPESIDDEKSGFVVDIGDKVDIIRKLELLITNPKLRSQMGEKANEAYKRKFTKKIWSEKMKQIDVL